MIKHKWPLHFVGIGGIGMSGIAEVFLNQGYPVSGSDQAESESTRRLAALGARIVVGHRAENIGGAKVVVVSSAVRPENPEWIEAKRRKIPVIRRAEMLAEIMRGKEAVAVAGSHGKTTTTSMIATVLTHAGLDPTLVIGGKVDSLGGNAKLGQGSLVVAEADESDGTFLLLPATWGVITNIDNDHLDHYGSLGSVESAFVEFVSRLPFYGSCVVCLDDSGVQRCLERFSKPFVTYGVTSKDAEFRAVSVEFEGLGSQFEVLHRERSLGVFKLHVPGRHNVLNALATIALCHQMGLETHEIRDGLAAFRGVKRRFEVRWTSPSENTGALPMAIVDDYGHHPAEITTTLEAARLFWKQGRVLAVFQPHRYSRTLHCHDGFLSAFHHADCVWMMEVYAAGEEPIPGISGEKLASEIRDVLNPGQSVEFVSTLDDACVSVLKAFRPGDLLLCLGAGSITRLPDLLIKGMEKRRGMA